MPVPGTRTTSTANQSESLIDIGAVAARLGVSVRHVRRLVADRRIPYLKWGHLLRFDPEEVEAWLDQARRPAPAVPSRAASPVRLDRSPTRVSGRVERAGTRPQED